MRLFKRWDEEFTTEQTDGFLKRLALAHAEQIQDKATRERVLASITSDVLYSVCDLDPCYSAARPLDSYHIRQCSAFFSKRADIKLGFDRKAVALAKFKESEVLCRETNALFKKHAAGRFIFPPAVEAVLHMATRKIAEILGEVPTPSQLKYRFGPGATTQVKKADASPRSKLGSRWQCSEDLLPWVGILLEEMPGWLPRDPTEVEPCDGRPALVDVAICDARLGFVPKNAKTHRGICVEPVLNSMFQLALGDFMTRRLMRFGVDLQDQTKNQRLAREGSITGALATLDLSSASDTIAYELVAALLPLPWFLVLSRARSGHAILEGDRVKLEKFSSMGNGFTFPLESLIFYALAWACTPEHLQSKVSVYGDDIIIPVEGDELLRSVLRLCGFLVNNEKSFSSGPFRESCGKDYLSGIDIRPAYIKNRLTGADAFVLHNYYVRTWQPDLAALVLSVIAEPLRKWGPDGYGDGHLLGDWTPQPCKRNRGYGGYTFETYSWKGRKNFKAQPGDFVYPCYSIYVGGPQRGLAGVPESTIDWLDRRSFFHGTLQGPDNRNGRTRRASGVHQNSGPSTVHYDKRGRLGDILPGRKGYKLISIYTFTRD